MPSFQAVLVLHQAVSLSRPVARRIAQHARVVQALRILDSPPADPEEDEDFEVGAGHALGTCMCDCPPSMPACPPPSPPN